MPPVFFADRGCVWRLARVRARAGALERRHVRVRDPEPHRHTVVVGLAVAVLRQCPATGVTLAMVVAAVIYTVVAAAVKCRSAHGYNGGARRRVRWTAGTSRGRVVSRMVA